MSAHPPRRGSHAPPIAIIFEDADLCAIDKPAGWSTVSERWDPNAVPMMDGLWAIWQKQDPDAPRPHVVHRLDKDTTGLLLFARNRDAQAAVRRQFRERVVQKSYLALAVGVPPVDSGVIEIAIDEDPRKAGRMRVVQRGGKECSTAYEIVERFEGYSLIRLRPKTGRTHQVRISLQHIGTPCAADPVYGDGAALYSSQWIRGYRKGRGREERPLLARTALHAETLALEHPAGQQLELAAALPKDLEVTLKQLRKWRKI
ncbi:MAG: RluA family pseudouridine synthase [Planctomycetota bacterium]